MFAKSKYKTVLLVSLFTCLTTVIGCTQLPSTGNSIEPDSLSNITEFNLHNKSKTLAFDGEGSFSINLLMA